MLYSTPITLLDCVVGVIVYIGYVTLYNARVTVYTVGVTVHTVGVTVHTVRYTTTVSTVKLTVVMHGIVVYRLGMVDVRKDVGRRIWQLAALFSFNLQSGLVNIYEHGREVESISVQIQRYND